MEALLEKEGKVENWNDDRLDELSSRMDNGFKEMREGFARVDREMKQGFVRVDREMKEGFARVDREMKEGFAEISRKLDRIPTREEIDHRFEATEGRVDRVSNRLEHMVWGLFAVGGGLLANLLAGNF
jgi:hypothetical protein